MTRSLSIGRGPCTGECGRCGCRDGALDGRGRMLAALEGRRVDRPPVWFMRQAGRHLPRYRAVRETLSFLELCREPDANAIVSAEPLLRYGLDAAIVFNDILTPLRDMGMGLDFDPGPRFERLVGTAADVEALAVPSYDAGADVGRCVRALRGAVGAGHAVLGFIGAPFTVAAFAVAGSGPQRRRPVSEDVPARRDLYRAMQEKLLPTLVSYAAAQIEAGADVIQVFESLAEDAGPAAYAGTGLEYLERVIGALREALPETPVIAFGRGLWPYLRTIALAGATAVSLDEKEPLDVARRTLREAGLRTALQGNLAPDVLLAGPDEARARAEALLSRWRRIVPCPESAGELGPSGWVFNLGHGVPATADPVTVQAVVDAVKAFDADSEEVPS